MTYVFFNDADRFDAKELCERIAKFHGWTIYDEDKPVYAWKKSQSELCHQIVAKRDGTTVLIGYPTADSDERYPAFLWAYSTIQKGGIPSWRRYNSIIDGDRQKAIEFENLTDLSMKLTLLGC